MTHLGLTVSDIGERLRWPDFRDFIAHLPPSGQSALYRARLPQSWWWTPELDFLGAVLTAIQWGNWQRGGGKGDKPKPVSRPKEKPQKTTGPTTPEGLSRRREAMSRRIRTEVDDAGN